MLKTVVCVSGGGTNLQAILDAIDHGTITNTQIMAVISNNAHWNVPGTKGLKQSVCLPKAIRTGQRLMKPLQRR